MSPHTARFFLSLPPVRGFFAVLFLILVTAVPFVDSELGLAARIGTVVVVLLLGLVIWAATLSGFVRDVREPRPLHDAVVVAHRPRRLARVLSWTALGVVILAGLTFVPLAATEVNDVALVLCTLSFGVSLPVASLLPRLSRWYADGAGLVAVSPDGLRLVPDRGDQHRTIPWPQLGTVLPSSSAAQSLPTALAEDLGGRVRWRPGACAAVARWADEGFDPTAEEMRALHLEPRWSSDPSTVTSSRGDRWGLIAFQSWATLACALLAGALIWAVVVDEASWWILLVLGWAPLLGVAILAPRLLRTLRTDGKGPAEVSPAGWVDHLHGQGLVAWEDIESIEVRDQHTLVTLRADAPPLIDRDLGNRMNHRLERLQGRSPVQLRSAGPLFRAIGPRRLEYPPESGAFALVLEVEKQGRALVLRN
ncbi:hypothetical protein CFK38_09940 [Brachybacterium vulturis]|uniref:Uncharacterized protein n=1 Tax=Brachybacterium vulturis TaxID=2017484 RepID=A0A291GP49_9MICO|nr:hypothetical protein [Brachybacterium vulturis]ATG51806.1 hypothetical protein CFK38_09940 [Brachybacterium vulturis]